MAAILLNIQQGDEVIIPSYTFVSSANPFILRGAKIIFVDSQANHPNMDVNQLDKLITPKTKVIVPVHYAGMACDMDKIMALANERNIFVVEDAAHAIDAYYKGKPLGSIGHLGTFSFHETKNIVSGEGGMLVINDDQFIERAEIIREKGTNRSKFFRGEVDKYGWVDIGSSFLPSDMIAAFLYAQCLSLGSIQTKRIHIWNTYYEKLRHLQDKKIVQLPQLPKHSTNNAHMFYLVCNNLNERTQLIKKLKSNNIASVFHYLSLHSSAYFEGKHDGRNLPNADNYTNCLLRLPFYYELEDTTINSICDIIDGYYKNIGQDCK